MPQIVTAATIDDALARGEATLQISGDAIVTASASERAAQRGLSLTRGNGTGQPVSRPSPARSWQRPAAPQTSWSGKRAAPGARYAGPRPLAQLCDFERVRDALRRWDLAGYVAALPHNVHYLSGFDCPPMWEFAPYIYAVVPRDGEPALVTGMLNLARPVEFDLWIKDVWPATTSDVVVFDTSAMLETEQAIRDYKASLMPKASANPYEAIGKVLADRGLIGKRLGFDDMRLTARLEVPFESVEAVDLMREVRMIKTEPEIALLRDAAQVNEAASLEAVRQFPRLGTWREVVDAYRAGMAKRSAQAHYLVGGVAHHMATFQTDTDYPLRRGDVFMVDALGTKEHYYGDFGRAGVWGTPDPKIRKRYQALQKGLWAGIEAARPGMLFRELGDLVKETIRREGNDNQRLAGLHSVGLEHTDQPRRPDMRVQANMVMNWDIGYMEAGFGALHLEDTFVVRDNGYELLTSGKNDLIVL